MNRRGPDSFQERVMVLTGAFVAVAIVVLACITAWSILTRPIPDGNETIVGQLQGSLLTSLGVIVSFFYVSSRTSQRKDEAIADMAKAQVNSPVIPQPGLSLNPGETATATATEDGTTISKDAKP